MNHDRMECRICGGTFDVEAAITHYRVKHPELFAQACKEASSIVERAPGGVRVQHSSYDDLAGKYADVEFRSVWENVPEGYRPRYLRLYQFPSTRFVTNSAWKQWWHLFSEVLEIGFALLLGNKQEAATETCDAKCSSETLHRILAGEGADISLAFDTVLQAGRERGYYREDESC